MLNSDSHIQDLQRASGVNDLPEEVESCKRCGGKGRVPSTPAIRMASFVMLGREKQTMVCPDCEGYGCKLAGSEAA